MTEEIFKRTDVETEYRQIPLDKIEHDAQKFAFREDVEYKQDGKSIAALAEELMQSGMLVPMLVQFINGVYLLLDGYRRFFASRKLVQQGQWPANQLVPAQVVIGDVPESERLLRLGASNLSRKAWDDGGMVRFATALSDNKVPTGEIARVLGKSDKQVGRYLLIGKSPWAQRQIADRNIDVTRLSSLLVTADKYNRREDFMAQLDAWVAATKASIMADNRRRERNDQEPWTGDQLDPQRHLKAEVVAAWKNGIKTGSWEVRSFRFKAMIEVDPTTKKRIIEIDGLKKDLDAMSLADAGKLHQRCFNLAEALEPILLEKKRLEAIAPPKLGSEVATQSAAMLRLAALGLEDLIERPEEDGDEDDDFDEVDVVAGEDLTATVQLPTSKDIADPEVSDERDA